MRKLLFTTSILFFLFISSSQTYEQQSLTSTLQHLLPNKPFDSILQYVQFNYFGTIISLENKDYYLFIEFFIRKGAHFVIFGFLAISIYWCLPKWKYRILIAFILTVLFAMLDEYHQSITGGRTATIHDIILDSFGAFCFLFVVFLITLRKNKATNKKR